MKKFSILLIFLVFVFSSFNCVVWDKIKGKVSVSDLKKVADMVDMDFGSGPDGPFKVEDADTKDSKVVIANDTDRTIIVEAAGPTNKTFKVASKKEGVGIVKPGKYHFKASAEGVKGTEGDVTLKGSKQYKWVFIIKKQ